MASLKRFMSMSIDDFRRKFGSERACREYPFGGRWPEGPSGEVSDRRELSSINGFILATHPG